MKNKITKKNQKKIYKSLDEALEAKHKQAKEFLEKVDLSKIAALTPTH